MKYIVHVIDDTTQHEKNEENQTYDVKQGIFSNELLCDIVRANAFYIVDSDSPVDAVVALSDKIKLYNEENEIIPLSEGIRETHKKNTSENSTPIQPQDDFNLKVIENNKQSNSSTFTVICNIPKEKYIEMHKVYFYICELEKTIDFTNNT